MSSMEAGGRIESMDQFRGYTVAGMFVVNFLGSLAAAPAVLKHHNTYFSYADSIMPSFLFACGFSYRLSVLRRLPKLGAWGTYGHVIRRSLALVLVSLVMYGFNDEFKSWEAMTAEGAREFIARLLKANLWEVLAIIGMAQILILPIIAARWGVRLAAMVGLAALHVALSAWFNYDFVHARPNPLDRYWGATTTRSWDGGPFGLLSWAIPMLGGSLAYDAWVAFGPRRAAGKLLAWGIGLMVAGYLMSCLTRLYDVPKGSTAPKDGFAASPMYPPFEAIKGRPLGTLLAEPPMVPPPSEKRRPANYWRMDKRVVSVPFISFSTGVAFALYGLFVIACDLGSWRLGLFRTLGRNPLAAYVIHHAVENAVHQVVPTDAPLWWCGVGLAVFFVVTYVFVRFLEKRNIIISL
jgi:predicted acyltransferase